MTDQSLAALLGGNEPTVDSEDTAAVVPYIYRHKKIAYFATGVDDLKRGLFRFEFRDHILTISGSTQDEADRKNAAFLKLASGLMPVDKINIVFVRQVQKELSLEEAPTRQVVRGVVGTADIADKPIEQNAAAPKTPAPATSGGLSFLRQGQ